MVWHDTPQIKICRPEPVLYIEYERYTLLLYSAENAKALRMTEEDSHEPYLYDYSDIRCVVVVHFFPLAMPSRSLASLCPHIKVRRPLYTPCAMPAYDSQISYKSVIILQDRMQAPRTFPHPMRSLPTGTSEGHKSDPSRFLPQTGDQELPINFAHPKSAVKYFEA
jgi:hypothetical protein